MNPEPVSITRIVRRMRGGSQAWLVLGDDGKSAPETRITREETHVIRGAFKSVSFRTGEIVRRIAVEGIVFGGDLMHAQVRACPRLKLGCAIGASVAHFSFHQSKYFCYSSKVSKCYPLRSPLPVSDPISTLPLRSGSAGRQDMPTVA